MYAIIEEGSHQFRVREGDRIRVDRRDGKPGDELVFPKVLLITGKTVPRQSVLPTVDGAQVTGKIVNQFRAKKIIIQKFRRRKNVRRKNGHRQPYTMVQITEPRSAPIACLLLSLKVVQIAQTVLLQLLFAARERFFYFSAARPFSAG